MFFYLPEKFLTHARSNQKKVIWFVIAFPLVSLIPHEKYRRWMNDKVSFVAFRIITRSLSAVIKIHNEEYRPKQCGFCVSNHTSPIDTAILASDCTYSMVSNFALTFF